MEMLFLDFCYFVGMLSFVSSGCWTCLKQNRFIIAPVCTILSAFGGGMIFRDVLVLKIVPGALMENLELVMTIFATMHLMYIAAFYYSFISICMSTQWVQIFLAVTDALGSGVFISIGFLKALQYNLPIPLCVLSGVVTTFGGGILAALVRGSNVKSVLTSSVGYRMIVMVNTIYFGNLQNHDIPLNTARCITVFTTAAPCIIRSIVLNDKTRKRIYGKILGVSSVYRRKDNTERKLLYFYTHYNIMRYYSVIKKYLHNHRYCKMTLRKRGKNMYMGGAVYAHRLTSFSAG